MRIQDRRDQPVDQFSVYDAVQHIVNYTNHPPSFCEAHPFPKHDNADLRTISHSFDYLSPQLLAHSPEPQLPVDWASVYSGKPKKNLFAKHSIPTLSLENTSLATLLSPLE